MPALGLIYFLIGGLFAYLLLYAPEWVRELLWVEVRINGGQGSPEEKAEVALSLMFTWPVTFFTLFLAPDDEA